MHRPCRHCCTIHYTWWRTWELTLLQNNQNFIGWIARILSASDISQGMLGRTNYNLNALSHDTAIALIRRVVELGFNVKEVNSCLKTLL